jgi:serine protease inhibitor
MHPGCRLLALLLFATAIGTSISSAAAAPSVDVAAADNGFGFRLLNAVQKTMPGGNVVLSPVSAALNLSMVLNGADGQTKQELLSALSLAGSQDEEINTANAQLIKVIRTPTTNVTLSIADSLWINSRQAKISPDYMKRMQASYGAEMVDLDFSDASAAHRINIWASKETHGKISRVIDRIEPSDLALLLNAVYFKAQWAHKFDSAKTQQRDFTLANGSAKQVPRMSQSGRFEYFETPDIQAIRLPFGAGDLAMEILLPAKSSNLGTLEAQLTPEHWKDWQARYKLRPGTIELPRFELQLNYRLNGALQALGIRRVFDQRGAQLTRMLSSGPVQLPTDRLSISSILQSIYWKVDEEGSEAAAVTTTEIRTTAIQRPEQPFQVIVDRPFFCAIRDQRSGALLFIGAIYDPAS